MHTQPFVEQKFPVDQVVYGADGETWPAVMGALRKGDVSDGPVTLVLERRMNPI